jgi:hypothetical protein
MPIRDDYTMNSKHLEAYGHFYVVDPDGYYAGRCALNGGPLGPFYLALDKHNTEIDFTLGGTWDGSFYFPSRPKSRKEKVDAEG